MPQRARRPRRDARTGRAARCATEKNPWMKELVVGSTGAMGLPEPHMTAASVTAARTPASRGPPFHARRQGAALPDGVGPQSGRVEEGRGEVGFVPMRLRVSLVRVPAEAAAHAELARQERRHRVAVVAAVAVVLSPRRRGAAGGAEGAAGAADSQTAPKRLRMAPLPVTARRRGTRARCACSWSTSAAAATAAGHSRRTASPATSPPRQTC
jgi:hypothetical protein